MGPWQAHGCLSPAPMEGCAGCPSPAANTIQPSSPSPAACPHWVEDGFFQLRVSLLLGSMSSHWGQLHGTPVSTRLLPRGRSILSPPLDEQPCLMMGTGRGQQGRWRRTAALAVNCCCFLRIPRSACSCLASSVLQTDERKWQHPLAAHHQGGMGVSKGRTPSPASPVSTELAQHPKSSTWGAVCVLTQSGHPHSLGEAS